jgi:hypothetical protein
MGKNTKRRCGGDSGNIATGFGLGIGFGLSNIVFIILALVFFIPGFLLFNTEKKKSKNDKDETKMYIGIGLMIIGCIFGFGLGFGFILSALGDMDI